MRGAIRPKFGAITHKEKLAGKLCWIENGTLFKTGTDLYMQKVDALNVVVHAMSDQDPKKAHQLLTEVLTELETNEVINYKSKRKQQVDALIVDSLRTFKKRMTSTNGSRPKETQQAIDVIHTAVLQGLNPNDKGLVQAAKKRLGGIKEPFH